MGKEIRNSEKRWKVRLMWVGHREEGGTRTVEMKKTGKEWSKLR